MVGGKLIERGRKEPEYLEYVEGSEPKIVDEQKIMTEFGTEVTDKIIKYINKPKGASIYTGQPSLSIKTIKEEAEWFLNKTGNGYIFYTPRLTMDDLYVWQIVNEVAKSILKGILPEIKSEELLKQAKEVVEKKYDWEMGRQEYLEKKVDVESKIVDAQKFMTEFGTEVTDKIIKYINKPKGVDIQTWKPSLGIKTTSKEEAEWFLNKTGYGRVSHTPRKTMDDVYTWIITNEVAKSILKGVMPKIKAEEPLKRAKEVVEKEYFWEMGRDSIPTYSETSPHEEDVLPKSIDDYRKRISYDYRYRTEKLIEIGRIEREYLEHDNFSEPKIVDEQKFMAEFGTEVTDKIIKYINKPKGAYIKTGQPSLGIKTAKEKAKWLLNKTGYGHIFCAPRITTDFVYTWEIVDEAAKSILEGLLPKIKSEENLKLAEKVVEKRYDWEGKIDAIFIRGVPLEYRWNTAGENNMDDLRGRAWPPYKGKWEFCPLCGKRFQQHPFRSDVCICSPCLWNLLYDGNENVTKQEAISYFQDLAKILQRVPLYNFGYGGSDFIDLDTSQKLEVHKVLKRRPSIKRVKELFGSWLNALVEAGILEDGVRRTSRGIQCLAKDGHVCLSLGEKTIDDFLYRHNIPHEKEAAYPESNFRADFSVGDFFIEYFGLTGDTKYDLKTKEKEELCRRHGIRLISIYPEDLISMKSLESKLKNVLG